MDPADSRPERQFQQLGMRLLDKVTPHNRAPEKPLKLAQKHKSLANNNKTFSLVPPKTRRFSPNRFLRR
jgi:hypothetical protein